MIFPNAHTACSQTFWWGEWRSLRKSGTASEGGKQVFKFENIVLCQLYLSNIEKKVENTIFQNQKFILFLLKPPKIETYQKYI